jgi:beta-glucosidase-like glycosyl hydrolase
MVAGMQEKDQNGYPKMAAFLKHFTAYSKETNRGHDTYNISKYDWFDTYLPQYKKVFTQNPKPFGVMCSYNAENGRPSCANDFLLNQQLRSWSPEAMVTTDCGAVTNLKLAPVHAPDDMHAAAYALMNGTDLEMGTDLFQYLDKAIAAGLATEERITEAVRRSFRVLFQVGRFDPPEATEWSKYNLDTLNNTFHQQVSYEAALQSLVLLKNSDNGGVRGRTTLPLKQGSHVAVVGPQGVTRLGLLSDYAADQMCFGGDEHCIGTVAEGIAAANVGGLTTAVQGVDVNSSRTDGVKEALAAAAAADVVVMVLGNDKTMEHEGIDRVDTALPGLQSYFAQQVLALNKTTVLVLTNGGALAIDELMERPATNTPPGAPKPGYAIVEAFNPAVVGGQAIGASLFGLENRWGKLPVTMYPHDFIKQQSMTNYDMSLAPGRTYKYYQGDPLFSFGFGLSLTTFKLGDCSKYGTSTNNGVSCTLTNTGSITGDEVVQLYHVAKNIGTVDHPLPKKALVDFTRVTLAPGSSKNVSFEFSNDIFKVVNKDGVRTLYPGLHEMTITRGVVDDEQAVAYNIPKDNMELVI